MTALPSAETITFGCARLVAPTSLRTLGIHMKDKTMCRERAPLLNIVFRFVDWLRADGLLRVIYFCAKIAGQYYYAQPINYYNLL